MNKKQYMTFFLLLVLGHFTNTSLKGQEAEAGENNQTNSDEQDESIVTDDHLLKLQRSYLLNLMVYSDDPGEKPLALQRLSQLIDSGQLQQDDELTINTLLRLAQQGTAQKNYDNDGNLTNNNFLVRAAACNLMGKLGGNIVKASLVSIMESDNEPTIVAIAMENILKIDPQGSPTLIENIVSNFYKYHYTNRDNALANTFIYVAAAYAANSDGKLLSPALLQAVHDVSLPSNSYTTAIRTKARSLILNWSGASYPKYEDAQ